MAKRQPWLRPERITEDKCCPTCGKKLACKEHRWTYRKWYEGLWPRPEPVTDSDTSAQVAPPSPTAPGYTSTSWALDERFYESFDESFLYSKAAALFYAVLEGEAFQHRANERAGLAVPLGEEFFASLRAELYFTTLQQIETLLALLLAPFQPLPHWVFMTKYTSKELTQAIQTLLDGHYGELTNWAITNERQFIEQALYHGAQPPDETAQHWPENLASLGWLIGKMATRYLLAAEYGTYRHGLHIKTAAGLLPEARVAGNVASALGPLDSPNDAFSFLELLDKGEKEKSVLLTSKRFSVEESMLYLGAAQKMLRIIKTNRLAALRGDPLPSVAAHFLDIDKDTLTQLGYRASHTATYSV